MSHCFIFANQLTVEGALALRLDDNKYVENSLKFYSSSELVELQKNSLVTVILPTAKFSLFQLELAELSAKKAVVAIPFALEDKVAEDIHQLHFSYIYHDGRYLVAVCSKLYFQEIISELDKLQITADLITLDWCALDAAQLWINETGILVNDFPVFQGYLDEQSSQLYLKNTLLDHTAIHTFSESMSKLVSNDNAPSQESYYVNLATSLSNKKSLLNLCQGLFIKKANGYQVWNKRAAGAVLVWLIVWIACSGYRLYQLNKQITQKDRAIANYYYQFFPGAKQIISPRFRIEQLIKNRQNTNSSLWNLLNGLAEEIKQQQLKIKIIEFNFQNKILHLKLSCDNFVTLESFQNTLASKGISVKQVSASSEDSSVLSELELNYGPTSPSRLRNNKR